MDLNLEKSDTFFVGINNSDTIIVDSVYTADNKKHIRFNYEIMVVPGYEKLEFIESVGTNFGLAYQGIDPYYISLEHYLLCSHKDGVLYYSNILFEGSCNVWWTKLDFPETNRAVKFYPNPVNNVLTIEIDNFYSDNSQLFIYNSEGKLIETINNIRSNTFEVNISRKPAGIYFFLLYNNNVIIKDKFIITNGY